MPGAASDRPTAIDLFTGAGGLLAGLERAGWSTVAAVDVDEDSIATLRQTQAARLPVGTGSRDRTYLESTRLLQADVAQLQASDLKPRGVGKSWRPDLLCGGPPCQPFSSAGRMRGLEDPRGKLFLEFVRLADTLRPRLILMENVQGLVTAKVPGGRPGSVLELVQSSFEEIGYACRFQLLNAADYGAPQRRVRLFMLASADMNLPKFPTATHGRIDGGQLGLGVRPWVSLEEFLESQPEPASEDVVRPSPRRARELATLSPGEGIKATGIIEANRPSGHWGYRQDCFLADPELPSRTIRAASTPDWIRLADGSLRRLTWRECAGLQGFDSRWRFAGNATSKFRQIGNAVQGQVAQLLGVQLLRAAESRSRAKPVSAPWPPSFEKRVRYTAAENALNGAHRAAGRKAAVA
jgi:DNA (cytosine-5)-methyltransferase 1